VRERAAAQPVSDEAPLALTEAWSVAVAPLALSNDPVAPAVSAWCAAPPATDRPGTSAELPDGLPPRLWPGDEAPRATRLAALADMVRNPGPLMPRNAGWGSRGLQDSVLLPRAVLALAPHHADDDPEPWRALLDAIDDPHRWRRVDAALSAYDWLLRCARDGGQGMAATGLGLEDCRRHLRVAQSLQHLWSRGSQMLAAAATYGSLPGVGATAYGELADRLAFEHNTDFWYAFLPRAAPFIAALDLRHPRKPWLVALALRYYWRAAITPRPRPNQAMDALRETTDAIGSGQLRFAGPHDGEGACRLLLSESMRLLAFDLECQGQSRVTARYRQMATTALQTWGREP
jgi:hypothetical protein